MSEELHTRRNWLARVAAGTVLTAVPGCNREIILPQTSAREESPPRAVQILIGGAISGRPALEHVTPEEFDPSGVYRQIRTAFPHVRKVVSITSASKLYAQRNAEDQKQLFTRLGARKVDTIASREEANRNTLAQAIEEADMVFMTGGDQGRLVDALVGTPALAALQKRLSDPAFILAGTSAGAACMSEIMINGGREKAYIYQTPPEEGEDRRPVTEQMRDGLGIFPAIVDTHFSQRQRGPRLQEALREHPGRVGIGLDEGTALVVDNGKVQVLGKGRVLLATADAAGQLRRQWLAGKTNHPIIDANQTHRISEDGWDSAAQGFDLFRPPLPQPDMVASRRGMALAP